MKQFQRIWLVFVVFILILLSRSIFVQFHHHKTLMELQDLRHQLLEEKQKERVLEWMTGDLDKKYETLEKYESVYVPKDIHSNGNIVHKLINTTGVDGISQFTKLTTILIYSSTGDVQCVSLQVRSVRKAFPVVTILIGSYSTRLSITGENIRVLDGSYLTEGEAINKMITLVKTEYFLYLSAGATLPNPRSSHNAQSLLNVFFTHPELDIVGASIMLDTKPNPTVRIPCFRLQACNWVLKQSFQYKYSVDDLIICEEVDTVFMAKLSNVLSLGPFDESLPSYATTDFFYRAKSSGAVIGLVPNVHFHVSPKCSHSLNASRTTELVTPFMHKHDVVEYRSASGNTTLLSELKHPLSAYQWFVRITHPLQVKGAVGSAEALDGLTAMLIQLDVFFNEQKLVYVVSWGAALASIKMRKLLPYDASIDIDILYDGPWRSTKASLIEFCRRNNLPYAIGDVRWVDGNEIIIFDRRTLVVTTLVCMENDPAFPAVPHQLFMMPLGGRFFPADRRVIRTNREYYGLDYLTMKGHDTEVMRCSVPGHHACITQSYARGGGPWDDFQCHL